MKIFQFFPLETPEPCIDRMALTTLPDSSIVKNGNPVYIPDFDSEFCGRLYAALRICRLGKSVALRFAHRYIGEIAPAIALSAEGLLSELRRRGLPWAEAISFDKACVLGQFRTPEELEQLSLHVDFSNGETVSLRLPEKESMFRAIEKISSDNTIKMGDLILLPLSPLGPFSLSRGSYININDGTDTLLSLPLR